MAFQKFASLEVLEVKSAPTRQRTASLSKFADYSDYRTDDGYMYVRVRAISSRVNKNHDGWPSNELQKAYRSFIGKPIFVDHHNHDPKRGRGVIVDAALHIEDGDKTSALDPYYANAPAEHLPPTWIELLLEVDAKRFPKLAKAVIDEDIDGVSMGANVELSKCSHCGNEARSPEQYCKHVQAKGAYFDYYMPNGQKISKRAYEDCYDIGFFEISFVFDPADETALVNNIKHAQRLERIAAIRAEADDKPKNDKNPMNIPQSEMTTAPEEVNTLRQEQVCPICGSNMEDGECEVCNYQQPPEGFQNPDLSKAKDEDQKAEQQQAQEAAAGLQQPGAPGAPGTPPPPGQPGPPQPPQGAMPTASSTSKGAGTSSVTSEKTSASQGRINTQERPILPATRQLSDKPIATKTVSEAKKPVESNNKENMTQTIKTADGATPQGDGVQADKRVDVEGVGAVSGDPLSGIEHENVEKDTGDFTGPHTDTWSAGEGDSLGQHEPVTTETGDFFTVSSTECDECDDCKDGCTHHESAKTAGDASNDVGGPIGDAVGDGGSAKDGGPTWDKSDAGFPDHQPARVDLNAPLKEEVGEGTKTFGSDDMHVGDPVTKDNANSLGGPIGTAIASAKAQMLKAMKIAETEIELGLTEVTSKFERIAELEDATEAELDAQLTTLSKVKTAGLKKQASAPTQKTAGRMPSFKPVTASFEIEAHSVEDDEFGLF